ncbi:DUF1002 domain-containing protein [Romboutsia sp. 1001713B170207_170306_H8]|nr:DUF1002 domain-containing protein [Romboutsia sp. 1001713B170207_170306_H8]
MTGIMKAFEDATGEPLDEDKKEIASEELIITGDLADEIGGESGQDKATGIINDIKTEIIKNNTSDTVQIAETINNITNNYNITLTSEQQKQIEELMAKIAQQDYDYNSIKNALNSVKDNVNDSLIAAGEIKPGFFDSIKNWFSGIGQWVSGIFEGNKDLGILENTNDTLLGDNAVIDATDKDAINLPSSEQVEGFFAKIWNWFTGLFDNNDSNNVDSNTSTTEESNDSDVNSLEQNSTTYENVQPDSSSTQNGTVENPSEDVDNSNNNDTVNPSDSEHATEQ